MWKIDIEAFPFFKEINRVVIWNLDFEIVLQNKQNSFYALVTARKQKKEEKKSINYPVPVMKEQLTTAKKPNK